MNVKYLILLLLVFDAASAASYGPIKDRACPDLWAVTDKVIYISANTKPWGVETDDKSLAKTHLSNAGVAETIDREPVNRDDLVDDLLTVASECLVYRNFLVDGAQFFPPSPSVIRNVATGWIPAAIF